MVGVCEMPMVMTLRMVVVVAGVSQLLLLLHPPPLLLSPHPLLLLLPPDPLLNLQLDHLNLAAVCKVSSCPPLTSTLPLASRPFS